VTFLDKHDLNSRFHNAQYPDQTKVVLACLMAPQGIPCIVTPHLLVTAAMPHRKGPPPTVPAPG
jgi:hypothetical protein